MSEKISSNDFKVLGTTWKERNKDSGRHEVLKLAINLDKLPQKNYAQKNYITDEENNRMIIEIPITKADMINTNRIRDAEEVFWFEDEIIVWYPARKKEEDQYSVQLRISPGKADFEVTEVDKEYGSGSEDSPRIFWNRNVWNRKKELAEKTLLSDREAEARAWKEKGLSYTEIADKMNISPNTVSSMMGTIKNKIRKAKMTLKETEHNTNKKDSLDK